MEPVRFSHLLLGLYPTIHLGLLLLDLLELILDVVVLTLRRQLFLLDLELMSKHLVLAPSLRSLVLPTLHAFPLPVEDLLVESVEFISGLSPMLLLLLLLQLLK